MQGKGFSGDRGGGVSDGVSFRRREPRGQFPQRRGPTPKGRVHCAQRRAVSGGPARCAVTPRADWPAPAVSPVVSAAD